MPSREYTTEELDAMLRDARDPATPPERLRRIVESRAGDAKVYRLRESVAANPNAPADLLVNLAAFHPAAFCQNPVAPLLLLERPDFVRRMPQKRGLLRCADAPPLFLEALTRHGDRKIREEAQMHVVLAGEVPDPEWRRALTDHWRAEVARAPKAQRTAYAELAALGLAPDWVTVEPAAEETRSLLLRASDPATPEEELDRIWTASAVRPETVRLWNGTAYEDRTVWRVESPGHALSHFAVSLNPSLPRRVVEGRPVCAYHETRYSVELPRGGGKRVLSAHEIIARHLPHYPLVHDAPTPPAGPDTRQRILAAVRDAASVLGRSARLPFAAVCARLPPDRQPPPAAMAQRGARSNHWHERLGAAFDLQPRHRKSAEALAALSDDGNRFVRAVAKARLRGETFTWED